MLNLGAISHSISIHHCWVHRGSSKWDIYLYHYAQRLQKLIYLHLPTDCFMNISLQSIMYIIVQDGQKFLPRKAVIEWYEKPRSMDLGIGPLHYPLGQVFTVIQFALKWYIFIGHLRHLMSSEPPRTSFKQMHRFERICICSWPKKSNCSKM